MIAIEVLASYNKIGKIDLEQLNNNINTNIPGEKSGLPITSLPATISIDGYEFEISEDGNVRDESKLVADVEAPKLWKKTKRLDENWYSYGGQKVSTPKLVGTMTPIVYTGNLSNETNKWANAITADGSMFVWIPRFAYKITPNKEGEGGYHSNIAGAIDIIFIDINNKPLNSEDEGKTITIDTTDEEAGIGKEFNGTDGKWLVHPAFTSKPENGGWDKELTGIWVGKFESTGEYDSESATGTLSVRPAVLSLREMTINEQYKFAKSAKFSETVTLNSHMAKNSEWGATAYLAHSEYGVHGNEVEKFGNSNSYTGGSNDINTIYTTNANQSTTYNATGVYDMSGGAWERTASYLNSKENNSEDNLSKNGGTSKGDLYGADESEQSTSTKWKTVYTLNSYSNTSGMKGDALYETSTNIPNWSSWFGEIGLFPVDMRVPFFIRSGNSSREDAGIFCFSHSSCVKATTDSFRVVLAP